MEARIDKIQTGQDTNKDDAKAPAEKNIFATEEIIVEEIAIDGICGVY